MSSLGDLMHALPAVHNLKVGLDADVDWVTHDYYVDLVKCFKDVDRVIPFYRKNFFGKYSEFRAELRKDEYDLIIDMQGLLKSALVAVMARGKRRIGPSFYREGTRIFYHEVAGQRNKQRHAVDENMDMVGHLGLSELDPVFPVDFGQVALEGAEPRIGIVPVSRWDTKNWPEKCFVDLMKRLEQNCGASFYLLGGKGDADVCGRIAQNFTSGVHNMAGKSSLVEMARILKGMDLVISNDSGPVHVAAAAGTPVLAIFGPTDVSRTGPYGEGHKVITAGVDCQPCFSRNCRNGNVSCLHGITPEKVAESAQEMLRLQAAYLKAPSSQCSLG
ncbi:hypothetical protein BVX97_02915 [bacterium E08(2017)]|nr:hypothetical protein BVX97_02915 [bacterium E08(2017)]